MSPPFNAASIAANQTNVAVVLAAFAFAAFVLLLDRKHDEHPSGVRSPARGSDDDAAASRVIRQAFFLLLTAFAVGVLDAFLYATSPVESEWAMYRGIVVAHGVFAIEVLALEAAVFWLLARWVDDEDWWKLWSLGVLVVLWVVVRSVAELIRAIRLSTDRGTMAEETALLTGMMLLLVIAAIMARAEGLRKKAPEPSPVVFSFVAAAVATVFALFHLDSTFSDRSGSLPLWMVFVIAYSIAVLAAWVILLTGPHCPTVMTLDDQGFDGGD